ncbi:MAG: glycosyltransferase family 2 protein, partial [Gramella sp.]|nr:glycosyltransferase family 2 protein [Christiangramia sp.]
MMIKPVFQSRFEDLNCCVIVPTYNNAHSLDNFLTDLKLYTNKVIIINDGSTDATSKILKKHTEFHLKEHPENKGKGIALKTGFIYAGELGYMYAITIDSDGQHYPDDLDVFLTELESKKESDPELLLVGDRKMGRDGIPGKSSKGNRFSNFWFLVVTGIELHDTQSGYRLYPVKLVNSLNLITWKFELEIEVLVKAAWKKADVRNIPI